MSHSDHPFYLTIFVVEEEDSLVYPNSPLSCGPRVLKQPARKLATPLIHK